MTRMISGSFTPNASRIREFVKIGRSVVTSLALRFDFIFVNTSVVTNIFATIVII